MEGGMGEIGGGGGGGGNELSPRCRINRHDVAVA